MHMLNISSFRSKMIAWFKLACLGLMMIASPGHGDEAEIDYVQSFDDWSVFIDGTDCWLASNPFGIKGRAHNDVFYYVTFHNNQPSPNNSVFFRGTTDTINSLKLHSPTQSYDFDLHEDTAYTESVNELPILKELLIRGIFKLELEYVERDKQEFYLSSSGFKDAYNSISKQCKFHSAGELQTMDGHNPV